MNSVSGLFLIDAWKNDWSIWLNTGYSLTYGKQRLDLHLQSVEQPHASAPNQQGLFVASSTTISSTTAVTVQSGYLEVNELTFKSMSTR